MRRNSSGTPARGQVAKLHRAVLKLRDKCCIHRCRLDGAEHALEEGLSAFIFDPNISLEEKRQLVTELHLQTNEYDHITDAVRLSHTPPIDFLDFLLEEKQEIKNKPYNEYLKTPRWQYTRILTLERFGHQCALCRASKTTLDVHHNTYKNLGDERPEDLIVLCRGCHRRHHTALAGGR